MSEDLVEAIRDLTRVVIAVNGNFDSQSDAIRQLYDLSIPQARIAAILAIPPANVRSVVSTYRKKKSDGKK